MQGWQFIVTPVSFVLIAFPAADPNILPDQIFVCEYDMEIWGNRSGHCYLQMFGRIDGG